MGTIRDMCTMVWNKLCFKKNKNNAILSSIKRLILTKFILNSIYYTIINNIQESINILKTLNK